MVTVSIKKLVSAIEEADAFHLPDRNGGTHYIYEEIYRRLTEGIPVHLSEINFNRFEVDDIDTMRELYIDILEVNENKAEAFTRILKNIPPMTATSKFI